MSLVKSFAPAAAGRPVPADHGVPVEHGCVRLACNLAPRERARDTSPLTGRTANRRSVMGCRQLPPPLTTRPRVVPVACPIARETGPFTEQSGAPVGTAMQVNTTAGQRHSALLGADLASKLVVRVRFPSPAPRPCGRPIRVPARDQRERLLHGGDLDQAAAGVVDDGGDQRCEVRRLHLSRSSPLAHGRPLCFYLGTQLT